ncbi:WD40-repeat-containing domain protein [Fomitopsis serialis]|uniref:WD40-repeat-containing domain protein n=1 Tax=Fomitopsis serialis TaxID=139415 RepID=UPI002008C20D|nr:WD40-repeat-containing domain protein [Neoantrodia serialis]KAH9922245.1 WD40-repeat-containing domain protein [Neoantrodia serialis]
MDGAETSDAGPSQLCVTPRRKRTWTPGSITNAYSAKRRRISTATIDWSGELESEVSILGANKTSTADRFITAPQEDPAPLNITPRSKRIARNFGLIEDRVLRCAAPTSRQSLGHELNEHRQQVQRLFATTPKTSPASAASHLAARKQFLLALDGPGIPSDPFAYPLCWSSRNAIAVACGRQLYYQNLDNRVITHLGTLNERREGRLYSIEWSKDDPINLPRNKYRRQEIVRQWKCKDADGVGGMDWRGNLIAVGGTEGTVEFFDSRVAEPVGGLTGHSHRVFGVRWSPNGDYLASSDERGIMQIWDARAGKALSDASKLGCKKRSAGPVKALAWCPWKPDLLASGSTYPEGAIRLWSVNASDAMLPQSTIRLDTSITSLIWSPHCKELLSTHGSSWNPLSSHSTPNLLADNSGTTMPRGHPCTKTKYTDSITVHSWPSLKHILSVPAHSRPVGHSCISPDGTMVFTICPDEEAMKMWKVWGPAAKLERPESVFTKFGIR